MYKADIGGSKVQNLVLGDLSLSVIVIISISPVHPLIGATAEPVGNGKSN